MVVRWLFEGFQGFFTLFLQSLLPGRPPCHPPLAFCLLPSAFPPEFSAIREWNPFPDFPMRNFEASNSLVSNLSPDCEQL
jgi:hypothetical protein